MPNSQIDTVPGQLDALSQRVSKLEIAVAENTDLTRDIRDALVAGKMATKAVRWFGAMAAAGIAIYAAIYQLLHHGKPP